MRTEMETELRRLTDVAAADIVELVNPPALRRFIPLLGEGFAGTMKVIAALTPDLPAVGTPASIRSVLDALGLPSRAPPIEPARQPSLELDDAA